MINSIDIRLLLLACVSTLFLTCKNDAKKDEHKNDQVVIQQIFRTDSSINGIIIDDTFSVATRIGNVSSYIDWDYCDCVILENRSETQFLRLHHSNGGFKNQFDIFTVGYAKELNNKQRKRVKKLDEDIFITENGIKLGLMEEQFLQIFSAIKFSRNKMKNDTIIYFYHDIYNTYLAEYKFKNGKLVEFRIGYDNS
jgi:hypothetical protein